MIFGKIQRRSFHAHYGMKCWYIYSAILGMGVCATSEMRITLTGDVRENGNFCPSGGSYLRCIYGRHALLHPSELKLIRLCPSVYTLQTMNKLLFSCFTVSVGA